jgi:uncharacterized membrane protein YgaE (UPF0421/DUF939 family)
MRDAFYGLIIGFFIGTLLVNLIKITFYIIKGTIILIIAILRKIINIINTLTAKRQNI